MMKQTVPSKEKLLAAVIKRQKDRAKAVDRMEKEIQKLYQGYMARVVKLVSGKKFLTSGTDVVNLQSATKAIQQLNTILLESGYESTIANYLDEFEELTRSATKYFNALGLDDSLAGIDVESLEAYAKFTQTELANRIGRDLTEPVQSALLQVNLGNKTRADVVEEMLKIDETLTTRSAMFIVDDAMEQYQRAVVVQKAEAAELEIYLYLGPDDTLTRPACEKMLHVNRHGVDGMLYKDEITIDLHDRLFRDPLIGGGGPNCRHHWSPVTEDFAVSMGFKPREQRETG